MAHLPTLQLDSGLWPRSSDRGKRIEDEGGREAGPLQGIEKLPLKCFATKVLKPIR